MITGTDPGFQAKGGALKKNCAEWREARKFLGYFVGKITILRQKIIFFQLRSEARQFLGYFVWKITILHQKTLFFPILGGGARRVRPPLDPPLDYTLTRVVIRVIITKINDNRLYDTSIYTVFFAVFFFNFDHMFFCFCQHIFCKFSESSIREFFYIF